MFGTQGTLRAFNPASGIEPDTNFGAGDVSNVDPACMLAQDALDPYCETSLDTRAKFLRLIAKEMLSDPYLAEEVFGPSSMLVECETLKQMLCVVECLPGQLTHPSLSMALTSNG